MAKIIETPILKTKRLIIRPHTAKDCETLQHYFNNWNIIKHLGDSVPLPYPEDGQKTHYINNLKPQENKGNAYAWVLCLKEEPEHPIGCINYRYNNMTPEAGDRGFWLAEQHWKKGYMTEAVTAVNDFAFGILKAEKMILTNNATNLASHRVKQKTGATFLKTTKEKWRDTEIEVEIWELTAKNWKKFREKNA